VLPHIPVSSFISKGYKSIFSSLSFFILQFTLLQQLNMSSAKVEAPTAAATTVMPDSQQPMPAQWTTNMTAGSLTASIGNSCLDEQIERLKRCEYLREGEVKALCLRAREILVDESNVQRVDAPVTVRNVKS
jgi:hypothetical protein